MQIQERVGNHCGGSARHHCMNFDGGDGEASEFRYLRGRMDRTWPWIRYGG